VPVTLHLDHCPERAVITECLDRGWNSVLFDACHLPVEENTRQTIEVVAAARRHGAHVEGEIESITGVEDGIHCWPTSQPARTNGSRARRTCIDAARRRRVSVPSSDSPRSRPNARR
jgi:fructose-bisphosphate aldolase class II